MQRRLILASLLAAASSPAMAQGKKGGSDNPATDTMSRLVGINGSFSAKGRNPDGSEYEGRCEVTQQDTVVEFTWYIGENPNRGLGNIDGRIVTVDWGDTTPVVYVAMDDGELHGTWADGNALEKLTPS